MTASESGQPFAGRAEELAALKAALEAAGAGCFSAAVVSGEPGIGKSRLVDELCLYARESGFDLAVGYCFDTHSGVSYFPFVQALRQLAHQRPALRQPGRAPTRRKKIAGAADRASFIAQGHTGTAADLIARLSGRAQRAHQHKPDRGGDQTKLFESVTGFLRNSSEKRPILIVLEDLDWADDGSLALLRHLVRALGPARLLLIATCCGTYSGQRSGLHRTIADLGHYHCCQRLRLKGFAENEAAALIQELLGRRLTDEVKNLATSVGRLANGNPLFLHQIVRHLIETGRIFNHHGEWMTSSSWESGLAAEDGMVELVDFRLSRLSERCRQALRHAAVLGAEFELELLAETLHLSPQALIDILEEARAAGILVDARSDEYADYGFAHALIRQSLYERLSRPIKRRMHADAARAIEKVHHASLDARLPQLALHYSRAGRAGDVIRAAQYCWRAGEMAYAVCAYADATSHWRAALTLAASGDRSLRAQILERLGETSLLSSPSLAEAARHLEAALKLYRQSGEQQDVARVHARLATVLSMRLVTVLSAAALAPDAVEAASHSRRAEKLLAMRSDCTAEGELLIGEAIVAHAQFRTNDGLALTQRAMDIGQSLATSEIWCQAAALQGHFLLASGKLKAGLELMEQAFERTEQARDVKPRFAAAWLRGFSYLLLWDAGAAEGAIQDGLAHRDNSQVEFLRHILTAHLGIAHIFNGALAPARAMLAAAPHDFLEANVRVFEGEWTRAEDLLNRQIERSEGAQSKQQHWTASFWLARLKRLEGQYGRAIELLTDTPLIAEQLVRVPEEIASRSELALVYLAQEKISDARIQVLRCRSLMNEEEDWRGLAAFVDRAEGALLAQSGQIEEAAQRFVTAARVFSKYRLPCEVAETLVTWGVQLHRGGRAEGAEKLDAAAEIYRRLGLAPRWQERIEQLRAPANKASLLVGVVTPAASDSTEIISGSAAGASGIYKLATTNDVALLATLIHDAISHLMNAIDKTSKLRSPIERIAQATEKISRMSVPMDRLIRTLEQTTRNSTGNSHSEGQRNRPGGASYRKLNRSHDPGRPL
jgi:predicted ATPase